MADNTKNNISNAHKLLFVDNVPSLETAKKISSDNHAIVFSGNRDLGTDPDYASYNIFKDGVRFTKFIGVDDTKLNVGNHQLYLYFDYDTGLIYLRDAHTLEEFHLNKAYVSKIPFDDIWAIYNDEEGDLITLDILKKEDSNVFVINPGYLMSMNNQVMLEFEFTFTNSNVDNEESAISLSDTQLDITIYQQNKSYISKELGEGHFVDLEKLEDEDDKYKCKLLVVFDLYNASSENDQPVTMHIQSKFDGFKKFDIDKLGVRTILNDIVLTPYTYANSFNAEDRTFKYIISNEALNNYIVRLKYNISGKIGSSGQNVNSLSLSDIIATANPLDDKNVFINTSDSTIDITPDVNINRVYLKVIPNIDTLYTDAPYNEIAPSNVFSNFDNYRWTLDFIFENHYYWYVGQKPLSNYNGQYFDIPTVDEANTPGWHKLDVDPESIGDSLLVANLTNIGNEMKFGDKKQYYVAIPEAFINKGVTLYHGAMIEYNIPYIEDTDENTYEQQEDVTINGITYKVFKSTKEYNMFAGIIGKNVKYPN